MSDRDYARRGVGCASEYARAKNDLYTTNPIAVTLLHNNGYLDKDTIYWECACGKCDLSNELIRLGYKVVSSDLFDYGVESNVRVGVDFLTCKGYFKGDIITNPPFKQLTEFILKGLELTNRKLFIFSRLQTLESVNRYEKIFKDNPPVLVLPFVKRVPCYKNGDVSRGSSVTPYAWYIWDKSDDSNETKVEWLI